MAGENQDELRDAALFAFNPETGGDLADGLEAGPVVALLQLVDIGADDCAPVLDPRPWAAIHHGGGRHARLRVIEEDLDVVEQRRLIVLEGQHVVAPLVDDLLGDVALAVERLGGHNGAVQR